MLANSGAFGYPSNFIARFYAAPAVGALVQNMMIDPDCQHRREMGGINIDQAGGAIYVSKSGKTDGFLGPNEFYYFWRRFYPVESYGEQVYIPLGSFSVDDFSAQLGALERVLGKPIVMKGIIANAILHEIQAKIPETRILHIQRDPLLVAQSILETRSQFYGDDRAWYSFRPPQCMSMDHLDPEIQVACQVHFSRQLLAGSIDKLPAEMILNVPYVEFCESPATTWGHIRKQLKKVPGIDIGEYQGPQEFEPATEIRLEGHVTARILETFEKLEAAEHDQALREVLD
jgi:hypothetical protein